MSLEKCILENLRKVLSELGLSFTEEKGVYDEDVPARTIIVDKLLTDEEVRSILRKVAQMCNCVYHEEDHVFETEDDFAFMLVFQSELEGKTHLTLVGVEE